MNFLVSRVSDVNAVDVHGNSALHLCVEYKSLQCARILINSAAKNNLDMELQNKERRTFLHRVISFNRDHQEQLVELATNPENSSKYVNARIKLTKLNS